MKRNSRLLRMISIVLLPALLLAVGCAKSDATVNETMAGGATTVSSAESNAPNREDVNLDGGGFQCDWHEAVELTEDDAPPAEESPVAYAEDENFLYDIYEDHVEIERYIGTETEVEVPATYDGLPVTKIQGESSVGDSLGFHDTNVKKVILPEGLTTIDNFAFDGCTSLAEINIPDSVTWIGYLAFRDTPWYESLTDEFAIVGGGCLLKYNRNDTDVTIPDGVKGIFGAFNGDEDLVSVSIPDSVTVISGAFQECTYLESITIPESVVEISQFSFSSCLSLTTVDIPESVRVLSAFSGCAALKEITGMEGVEVLGGFDYTNFEKFPFPEGLVEIEYYAFMCSALEEVDLPQSLKSIEYGAFFGCGSLKTVKNGQNVVRVDFQAFVNTPWLDSKTDYFVTVGKNVLIAYNGADTEVEIPDTVTYLGGAFWAEQSNAADPLQSVVIPESVRGITANAFFGHPNLSKVQILGENVVFGEMTFSNTSLESCTLPEGTTVIPYGLFSGADSLKEVVLPDSVLLISDAAFEGCGNLIDITIPVGVMRIGEDAFAGCGNITIHGAAGSVAESYAAEHGMNFVIDGE
ncbi:MAG: leucine-rich repeat domain-containing protein [Lachnospiraceae bacterium]|nr:leucine-rich repeat domain-containing protein [Lachnospiraceae bacterium]